MQAERLLRLPAVIDRTGLGRDSIYRKIRAKQFPSPVKISDRASGWVESEVDQFIQARIQARTAAQQSQ